MEKITAMLVFVPSLRALSIHSVEPSLNYSQAKGRQHPGRYRRSSIGDLIP